MSPLEQLAADYLDHCKAKGLSPKTIRDNYGYTLRELFLPFCAAQGVTKPSEVSQRIVDRWQADLLERPARRGGKLSRHSIDSWARAVNRFLNWAKAEDEITQKVVSKGPRLPKSLIEVLDRSEIQRLEDAAKNERDKLIVRLFADTGIRASELLGLTKDDLVERDRGHYIHIRHAGAGGGAKGRKERLVAVPNLWKRLKRYADTQAGEDGHLFMALLRPRKGEPYEPLALSGLQHMIRNLGEVAGIKKRVYPHLLRHSYATHMLRRQMNPVLLANTLGHSSLTMIMRNYQHLSPSDAHAEMARILSASED